MTGSLIPAAALQLIGEVYQRMAGVISARECQRWAAAVGDGNRLYFEADYARAHGYRDGVMPPLFLSQSINPVVSLAELGPDGVPRSRMPDLPLPARRMAGGEISEFFEPVCWGDAISSVRRLAAIDEKSGRSGRFVLVRWQTDYYRDEEVRVARITSNVICR
jgi:N-terminal half of MaoC dehydratase